MFVICSNIVLSDNSGVPLSQRETSPFFVFTRQWTWQRNAVGSGKGTKHHGVQGLSD